MRAQLLHALPIKTEEEILPDGTPLVLVQVKKGAFLMGNNEADWGHEKPAHAVKVNDFRIGQFPITNQQYVVFLNEYGSTQVREGEYKGKPLIHAHNWGCQLVNNLWEHATGFGEHPVINITWFGANEFCIWLNSITRKKFCLPSEAQWEYAARGGQDSMGSPFAAAYKLKEVGWYDKNSHAELKPVGLKAPNELGLYDMSGNVWEWCLDSWHKDYQGAPDNDSPWLKPTNENELNSIRVYRGGSWFDFDFNCRVSKRGRDRADYGNHYIGFRIVQN